MEHVTISAELKSHFLRLYQIALSDEDFSPLEMQLLYRFAAERGIDKKSLDALLMEPQEVTDLIPETLTKKLEYLCDFAYMILADGIITVDERSSLEKYIRLFGFLEENVTSLADYLLTALEGGKTKQELLTELTT